MAPESSEERAQLGCAPMRVLMLAWEFPPRSVGGVAAHVDGLSQALAAAGHDVVLFTLSHPGAPPTAPPAASACCAPAPICRGCPTTSSSPGWRRPTTTSCSSSAQLGDWRPDVVHAHDWQVAWAADTLSTLHGAKLVATFHATERGQHGGRVPPGRAEHDPRRRVVARPRRRRGGRQLEVHGQRGRRRVRAARRAHPPDPQRHRPDVVVDGRDARQPDPARVHVGPGPVREGLPGARPGDAAAAPPGAGHRVHHRRARQLPPRAAVADRPRGRQRPRPPARASSPTTGCATPSTAPAASPSRRCTSRSASSPSRRWPAARRSSSPAPAGSPS